MPRFNEDGEVFKIDTDLDRDLYIRLISNYYSSSKFLIRLRSFIVMTRSWLLGFGC